MRRLIGALGAALIVTICLTLSASPAVAQPAGTGARGTVLTCPWADYPLDCWIKQHPRIADAIVWEFSDGVNSLGPKAWPQWPKSAKDELRVAFQNAVAWYNSGMTNYPGTLVVDPPPDVEAYRKMAGLPSYSVFSPSDAWPIYLGHVGLSLAAEIYGWVPWSLNNYDDAALGHLFNAYENWFVYDTNNGIYYDSVEPGYIKIGGLTPANATYTLKFLKDNDLIGATKVETIGRVLTWTRKNLWHMSGNFSFQNMYYHWQYWGDTPLSRVIEGTVLMDPNITYFPGVHHWTAACGGTSAFLVSVLRVVNIPAEDVHVGHHGSVCFSGEKLYLSHGDDAGYGTMTDRNMPATELLISEATYQAWFPFNDINAADKNVGRREVELAITYPGDYVLGMYCDDVANGRDHASGKVYNNIFKNYYTLKYLEIVGLWDRLAQKAGDCLPVQ